MSFLHDLQQRGLVHQTTDAEGSQLAKLLGGHGATGYVGFDPTADSLHVGSLLPVLNLVRLQKAGHRPIAVVGGATGMIGDPSGKTQERQLLDAESLDRNARGIKKQLERFLDFSDGGKASKGALLVNNYDWFKGFQYIEFLRDVGKLFSVNTMLARESVRARLEDRDHGISYNEFSYMLLQAYDFLWLHKEYGCTLQMGGSDQWGNIVAGIDLIRRVEAKEAYGITWPLVTKADGSKFGKSEKGNVWLDAERTSPYEFYQFFMQTDDRDVVKYLNSFTFLSARDIADLAHAVEKNAAKREAQRVLAEQVTEMVHGKAELAGAQKASQALFGGGDVTKLDSKTLLSTLSDAPVTEVPHANFAGEGMALVDLLVTCEVSASKGAARRDIEGGGIAVNNEKVTDPALRLQTDNLIDGKVIVLRKGKKHYHVVKAK